MNIWKDGEKSMNNNFFRSSERSNFHIAFKTKSFIKQINSFQLGQIITAQPTDFGKENFIQTLAGQYSDGIEGASQELRDAIVNRTEMKEKIKIFDMNDVAQGLRYLKDSIRFCMNELNNSQISSEEKKESQFEEIAEQYSGILEALEQTQKQLKKELKEFKKNPNDALLKSINESKNNLRHILL